MTVTLKPDQQAWLERQVQEGRLASIEDGVTRAVADMMAIEADDLAWAKDHVEAARTDVARGDVIAGADVIASLKHRPAG